jgi:hypothetical protein
MGGRSRLICLFLCGMEWYPFVFLGLVLWVFVVARALVLRFRILLFLSPIFRKLKYYLSVLPWLVSEHWMSVWQLEIQLVSQLHWFKTKKTCLALHTTLNFNHIYRLQSIKHVHISCGECLHLVQQAEFWRLESSRHQSLIDSLFL